MTRLYSFGTWLFSSLAIALAVLVPLTVPENAIADGGSDCSTVCNGNPTCVTCCEACNGDPSCISECSVSLITYDDCGCSQVGQDCNGTNNNFCGPNCRCTGGGQHGCVPR